MNKFLRSKLYNLCYSGVSWVEGVQASNVHPAQRPADLPHPPLVEHHQGHPGHQRYSPPYVLIQNLFN